jgi:hypothetical protein
VLLVVIVCILAFPPQAQAYLDPGTGSLIVQSVIAAFVAGGFAIRLYWRRITHWLKGSRKGDDRPPP